MTRTAEPESPRRAIEPEPLDHGVTISIVVPAFNEAENIPLLHSRLVPVLQRLAPDA